MSDPQIARTPPQSLEAMLFDLDGTVADTHGLIRECYDYAIRTHLGQPAPMEVWQQRVGLPLDTVLLAACAHYGAPCSEETLAALKTSYRARMRTQRDNVAAFPGVSATLAELRQRGLRLAIVTTKYREMALHHLEVAGLAEIFEVVVAGDDCEHTKPHPEPFHKALAALNIRPQHAAMVGDSQYDILGAHNAGVYGVAACWGTDSRDDLLAALPDLIAERPDELLGLLPTKI
jgi:pyrophosphatase PpaX